MSQTETGKAVAAEERTEEAKSFVRRVKQLLGASTPRKRRFVSVGNQQKWDSFSPERSGA